MRSVTGPDDLSVDLSTITLGLMSVDFLSWASSLGSPLASAARSKIIEASLGGNRARLEDVLARSSVWSEFGVLRDAWAVGST